MKKSVLYTRTGDAGTTSLVGGERVLKCNCRIDAYGTVDELNVFLGLLAVVLNDPHDRQFIIGEQNRLFALGCCLATPSEVQPSEKFTLKDSAVERIEQEIDRIDAQLPRLKSFTIPGGSEASARAHVCRAVCRRAEREMYRMAESEPIDPIMLKYINRFSDYLYVLSRKLLQNEGVNEILWDNDCV